MSKVVFLYFGFSHRWSEWSNYWAHCLARAKWWPCRLQKPVPCPETNRRQSKFVRQWLPPWQFQKASCLRAWFHNCDRLPRMPQWPGNRQWRSWGQWGIFLPLWNLWQCPRKKDRTSSAMRLLCTACWIGSSSASVPSWSNPAEPVGYWKRTSKLPTPGPIGSTLENVFFHFWKEPH